MKPPTVAIRLSGDQNPLVRPPAHLQDDAKQQETGERAAHLVDDVGRAPGAREPPDRPEDPDEDQCSQSGASQDERCLRVVRTTSSPGAKKEGAIRRGYKNPTINTSHKADNPIWSGRDLVAGRLWGARSILVVVRLKGKTASTGGIGWPPD
jgi:hypothetical protein